MKASELERHLCHERSDYRAAKRAISERYLGIPRRGHKVRTVKIEPEVMANLVGIGVAEKRTDRSPRGVPAITFYVERKLPKSRLTRRLMLPKTLDGLTCDVAACGRVRPAMGGSPSSPLDPLTPGAQIQIPGAAPGTLGAFVRDSDGDICLISNCHVLSLDLANGVGQPVTQPAQGYPGARRIATVKTIVSISADSRNRVDVALAKLDFGINHDPVVPGIGGITGTGVPSRSEPVAKFGQATWFTDGRFDSIDTDLAVSFDFITANFSNIYVFRPANFAGDGDSGSLVMEPTTGIAVGLIFATSPLLNFAIPVDAINENAELSGLTWL